MKDPTRQWRQPLPARVVRPLIEATARDEPAVAHAAFYALVRLPLTSASWLEVENSALVTIRKVEGGWGGDRRSVILDSLARVPTPRVRESVLGLAQRLERGEACELLLSLGEARDNRVTLPLIALLAMDSVSVRVRAAVALAGLTILEQEYVEAVFDAYVATSEVQVRFWLAVALARVGRGKPLLDTLSTPFTGWEGFGECSDPEGSGPDVLQDRVRQIPFEIRHQVALLDLPNEVKGRSNKMRELAAVIMPEQPWPECEPELDSASEPDAETLEQARRLVESWCDAEPDWGEASAWAWSNWEALQKVDPVLSGRAIGRVFQWQVERVRRDREGRGDALDLPFDACGEIIASMLRPLQVIAVGIDVRELFDVYCAHYRIWRWSFMEVGGVLSQLAAIAACRSPAAVIEGVVGGLHSDDPTLAVLGCEFVELTRRYVGWLIPTWGGGAIPPDESRVTAVAETRVGEEILYRQPALQTPARAEPGETIDIRVDLTQLAEPVAGAVALTTSVGWESLVVDVALIGVGLDLEPKASGAAVTLRRDGTSEPFECGARVVGDIGTATLHAVFSYQGRLCGTAAATIRVLDQVGVPLPPVENVAVDVEAEPAMLTVTILPTNGGDMFIWNLDVAPNVREEVVLPAKLHGGMLLPPIEFERIRETLSHSGDHSDDEDSAFFDGLGTVVYDCAPPVFQDVYRRLRDRFGDDFPVQFVTGDPGIPWELMCPEHQGKRQEPLCKTHPFARWHLAYAGQRRQCLGTAGGVVSVVPRYDQDRLLDAEEEQAEILAELSARKITPATKAKLLEVLDSKEACSALHIAAHATSASGAWADTIALEGATSLTAIEVRGCASGVRGALVMLNACEAGDEKPFVGLAAGFPEAFVCNGARAVVAPLWAVYDGDARDIALQFLRGAYLKRRSLGEALRDARWVGDADSHDALAYVLFGDVMARFVD